jgi:hypothetical protein
VRLNLGVVKPQAGGSATANFDNVVFKANGTCASLPDVLCLNQGRFQVEADWDTVSSSGRALAVQLTPDTGYLWFFHPDNVEVVIKVLAPVPSSGSTGSSRAASRIKGWRSPSPTRRAGR